MANINESLTAAVEGLWRDRSNDPNNLPGFLRVAPVNAMLGNGQYQIMTSDTRLDERDSAQGGPVSDYADFVSDTIGYSTVSVVTTRHASKGFPISEAVMAALEGQNGILDLAQDAMNACSNQILDKYSRLAVGVATSGLTSGGTIAASTASTDITSALLTQIEAIDLASGKTPNVLLIGMDTFRNLMQNDQVFGQPAIGGAASGGSFRRLGALGPDAVSTYFRTVLGLELVVDGRSYTTSAGAKAYTLADRGILAYAAPRGGCMTTFSRESGLIKYNVHDTSYPQVPGVAVTGEAWYEVAVTDPSAGRIITFS